MADISLKLQLKPKMTQIQSLTIKMLGLRSQDLTDFLHEQVTDNPLLDIRYPDVRKSGSVSSTEKPIDNIRSHADSPEEMLMKQLRVLPVEKRQLMAAGLVIRSLDEKGFFVGDLDELGMDYGLSLEDMQQGLAIVQSLDPPGIGAVNICDALLIQSRRSTGVPDHTEELLQYHYEDFLKGRWQRLRQEMAISDEELKGIRNYLKTLSLQPIHQIEQQEEFVRADVEIYQEANGRLAVRMLEEVPEVFFRDDLYAAYEREGDRQTKTYIHKAHRSFLDLQSALAYRRQSVLKIVEAIAHRQESFFLMGTSLRPLTQKQVAMETELSPSTVSRVCRDRYILYQQRIRPVQDFFAQPYGRISDGGERQYFSDKAIMEEISRLVQEEDGRHPYSDQQLVEHLRSQDIAIARRTVTKFRLALGIPNSNMRRHMRE